MSPSPIQASEPKFLNSWKEIANYMGKGVRTVQRYEAHFGLPVRRPAGKSRAAVVATCAEIDAWIAARPIRETLQLPSVQSLRNDPDFLALQEGVKEMRALREQLAALRAETRLSLNLLLNGVRKYAATQRTNVTDQTTSWMRQLPHRELTSPMKRNGHEM